MSELRRKALEGFLEKDPNDAFTRYALALEYQSLGEKDRAYGMLLETIERNPDYAPAYHQLALWQTRLGKIGEAERMYRLGITAAQRSGETHERNEMQQELEDLLG